MINLVVFFIAIVINLMILLITLRRWRKYNWFLGVGFSIQILMAIPIMFTLENVVSMLPEISLYILLTLFLGSIVGEIIILYLMLYIEMVSIGTNKKLFIAFGQRKLTTIFIIFIVACLLFSPQIIFSLFYALSYTLIYTSPYPSTWDSIYLSFSVYYSLPFPNSINSGFLTANTYVRIIPIVQLLFGKLNELLVIGLFVAKIQNALHLKIMSTADEISKFKALYKRGVISQAEYEKVKTNLLRTYDK